MSTILLIFMAIILHLNPSVKDGKLSTWVKAFRLIFSISVAILIPTMVEYLFWNVTSNNTVFVQPYVIQPTSIVFSIGLQFMAYGKLSNE